MRQQLSKLNFKVALLAALLLLALTTAATTRQTSTARASLAFAAIGDTGTGKPPQFEVARQMAAYRERVRFDFVLMLGDNLYTRSTPAAFRERFEKPYQELLQASVKFYAVLGNHDVLGGGEAQIRYEKFNMSGRRYYSFTKGEGLVEFFALDSNNLSRAQTSWLEEKLKSSVARWKVAFLHHSLFSSSRMHSEYDEMREQLTPLFVRYGVNAVFAGHSHVYERVKPQQGVHYFTQGASGKIRIGDLDRNGPYFAAGNDQIHSFLLVQMDEARMKVEAIGANGELLDSAVISRGEVAN